MKSKNGKTEIIIGIVGLYVISLLFGANFGYNLGKTHNIMDSIFNIYNVMMIPLLIISIFILLRGIKAARGMKDKL